jgi:hypothetical protein
MPKKLSKQALKRRLRDETASIIADIANKTPRYVRMVKNGEKNNDAILNATILYEQGKNELIQKIKKLVPFN